LDNLFFTEHFNNKNQKYNMKYNKKKIKQI
jgi:hypothetical protein